MWSVEQKSSQKERVPDEVESGGGGCLVSGRREGGGDGGGRSPWELIGTLGNRRKRAKDRNQWLSEVGCGV